jgi:peptide chain release factor 3
MEAKVKLTPEVARRRTFAIISHPDAGKTTLTEKLLLYGGAIHLAGSVKARKDKRFAASDWMAIEKERGISVTSSVMQFEHLGVRFNLLDTPGHNDFSEDTYRTLSAADCAVMLIDCVKGVEPQTIKLFEVCRLQKIPIVTFINKMDRFGKQPLDLLDEIETVLGIPTTPLVWPVGAGQDFQGVFDREHKTLIRFERGEGGGGKVEASEAGVDDPSIKEAIGSAAHQSLKDELALLDAAGNAFDRERFLSGAVTPVFFGSAMTNFGVEPFLDRLISLAPAPRARESSAGVVEPDDPELTGFVFKIQANMDPNHRDRIAFVRITSGKFTRGMDVKHVRSGKKITIARSLNFLASERISVEEAFAGDIIGVWDPGVLRIGDSLSEKRDLFFDGVPSFSPEHFVRVRLADPMKRKQLKKGLMQLSEEGAVQLFTERDPYMTDPILGAVGVLQLEVAQYRLKAEYSVEVRFDTLPFHYARWVEGPTFNADKLVRKGAVECMLDIEERPILLFESDWARRYTEDKNPELKFIAANQPGRSARA